MSTHWDFYFFVVDGKPCSTMLDLGLVNAAPIATKPWLVCVRLPLKSPRSDGLTTTEEAEELGKLEEALQRALARLCQAVFVGRMTWSGTRDLFFYAAATEGVQAALQGALGAEPKRRVVTQVREDREWRHYLDVLFPGPLEEQWMADRRLVDELRKGGDRLEQPRAVDHTATFPTQSRAEAFVNECRAMRFEAEARATDDGSSWTVRATRVDAVELAAIHDVVASLLVLVEENEGRYRGWSCGTVRTSDA